MNSTYALAFLLFSSVYGLLGGDDCEECTFQIDESIACVNELLERIEPVTVFKTSPCQSCDVYGIHDFKRTPGQKVCSHKTLLGGVRHKYHVTFTNLTMKCACAVPANVNQLLINAASAAIEFNAKNCPVGKVLESVESIVMTGLPPLNPNDLLNLPECKSVKVPQQEPAKKGGKNTHKKKQPAELVTGNMIVEWLGPQVTFESETNPQSGKVSISHVTLLTTDYNAMRAWCGGSDNFSSLCRCMVAGKFQVYMIAQFLHLILPCRVNDEAEKQQDIVDYFKCND